MDKHRKKKGYRRRGFWSAIPYITGTVSILVALFISYSIRDYAQDIKKSTGTGEKSNVQEDYYCELIVPDSDIRFPVMKGLDNEKYLHTSMTGEESQLGAIFMDYRCDFYEGGHIIVYGHDAQDIEGNLMMFGKLREYLDEDFIVTHPEIELMKDGKVKKYVLFAIKVTDIHDDAYQLGFEDSGEFEKFLSLMEAPDGTTEILTLSTCLGQEEDGRLIIQGALQ